MERSDAADGLRGIDLGGGQKQGAIRVPNKGHVQQGSSYFHNQEVLPKFGVPGTRCFEKMSTGGADKC